MFQSRASNILGTDQHFKMAGQILLSDFTARGRPVTTWGKMKFSSIMMSSRLSTVASTRLSTVVSIRLSSAVASSTPQNLSVTRVIANTASISFTYYAYFTRIISRWIGGREDSGGRTDGTWRRRRGEVTERL